jgi:chromosome segregation ATPase
LLAQRAALLDEQRVRVQADVEHVRGEQKEAEGLLATLHARITPLIKDFSARSDVAAQAEAALAETAQRHRGAQASLEAARAAVMERVMAATAAGNRLANDQARAAELRRRADSV